MPNPTTVSGEVERVADAIVAAIKADCTKPDGSCYAVGNRDAMEVDGEFDPEAIAHAVLALRVEPPSDVAEIVGHLRKFNDFKLQRAADKLEQQALQIAERDEVLRGTRKILSQMPGFEKQVAKLSALIGNEEVSDDQP
jgi:hypothetical protein